MGQERFIPGQGGKGDYINAISTARPGSAPARSLPEAKPSRVKKPWNLKQIAIGAAALAITAAGVGGVIEGPKLLRDGGQVPSTFDNNAGSTRFGENNIVRITPQEAEAQNLLVPKITVDNNGAVTVNTLLTGIFSPSVPDTQIDSKSQADVGRAPSVVEHFTMPEGYQLTIPKGAHYALLKPDQEANRDPNLVYSIVVFYYDPVNKLTLTLGYESTGFVPGDGQKTFDRNSYNQLYNPTMGGRFENLPLSDGTTPIAKPASANQKLDVFLFALSGTLDDKASISDYMKVKWENPVDSNQKLIVLSTPSPEGTARADGTINYGNGVIGPTPADVQRANSGK